MIKTSIKKRFEKMIKYCNELIEKCENRTIDEMYRDAIQNNQESRK